MAGHLMDSAAAASGSGGSDQQQPQPVSIISAKGSAGRGRRAGSQRAAAAVMAVLMPQPAELQGAAGGAAGVAPIDVGWTPRGTHAIPLSLLSIIPVDLAAILRVLVLCTVTANSGNTVL